MIHPRTAVAVLTLSASALVGIAQWEDYRGEAYTPVPGDKPTIGFGTTTGVKPGDKITPPRALVRLLEDANEYEKAVKRCAPVPMYQHEYDSMIAVAYNIGPAAFCGSSMASRLVALDYRGACEAILMWDKYKGRPLKGLTKRRQAEYRLCIGGTRDV